MQCCNAAMRIDSQSSAYTSGLFLIIFEGNHGEGGYLFIQCHLLRARKRELQI